MSIYAKVEDTVCRLTLARLELERAREEERAAAARLNSCFSQVEQLETDLSAATVAATRTLK